MATVAEPQEAPGSPRKSSVSGLPETGSFRSSAVSRWCPKPQPDNAFNGHLRGLSRTKEQLTKTPPDGNIWKAIRRDFKAMCRNCSCGDWSQASGST